ncbi:PTS sugar transporter subunit IIB [Thermoflavimicrobium daqui]|uniref:PTS fructose transporter subunit IIB n=1 Tax=Thermoflavimicrobium daqui TaxID=2137476 RepID=A0A364K114_9BACL|nr:PTS sugar transporter subunit IIB [Thermoflavimicrobium daqui]RAL21382.1 PTS fructose transporter subunit IIB [Thermoflavimicrobium daqui]
MRTIHVLTVCGSGTVSSTMVAEKLKDILLEQGIQVKTVEIKPTEVLNYIEQGGYDFIAYTTPIPEQDKIPAINAVGFLTGFGEEEFLVEVQQVINKLK